MQRPHDIPCKFIDTFTCFIQITYTIQRPLGSRSKTGNRIPLVKVAAMNAIARCSKYVDTQFVSHNIPRVIQALRDAEEGQENPAPSSELDLVRLAGYGKPCITTVPRDIPQNAPGQLDKGWWNKEDGIQRKRPQMGQSWRLTYGMPIFYDQTYEKFNSFSNLPFSSIHCIYFPVKPIIIDTQEVHGTVSPLRMTDLNQ